jgi:hypothetical protein
LADGGGSPNAADVRRAVGGWGCTDIGGSPNVRSLNLFLKRFPRFALGGQGITTKEAHVWAGRKR